MEDEIPEEFAATREDEGVGEENLFHRLRLARFRAAGLGLDVVEEALEGAIPTVLDDQSHIATRLSKERTKHRKVRGPHIGDGKGVHVAARDIHTWRRVRRAEERDAARA